MLVMFIAAPGALSPEPLVLIRTPGLHKQSHNGEFNLLPGTTDGLIAKYCLCEPTCLVIHSVGTSFL